MFTSREKEVLAGLAEGKTVKEIAWEMFVSPKTVEVYCARVKAKVGDAGKEIKNMHQPIVYAVRYVYVIDPFRRRFYQPKDRPLSVNP